jgi:hypothetical protein
VGGVDWVNKTIKFNLRMGMPSRTGGVAVTLQLAYFGVGSFAAMIICYPFL